MIDHQIHFLYLHLDLRKTFPNENSSRKAQDRIFSTSVDSLLFEYLDSASPPAEALPADAKKIKITLTLKQKSGVDVDVQTLTSEVNLRNN